MACNRALYGYSIVSNRMTRCNDNNRMEYKTHTQLWGDKTGAAQEYVKVAWVSHIITVSCPCEWDTHREQK